MSFAPRRSPSYRGQPPVRGHGAVQGSMAAPDGMDSGSPPTPARQTLVSALPPPGGGPARGLERSRAALAGAVAPPARAPGPRRTRRCASAPPRLCTLPPSPCGALACGRASALKPPRPPTPRRRGSAPSDVVPLRGPVQRRPPPPAGAAAASGARPTAGAGPVLRICVIPAPHSAQVVQERGLIVGHVH